MSNLSRHSKYLGYVKPWASDSNCKDDLSKIHELLQNVPEELEEDVLGELDPDVEPSDVLANLQDILENEDEEDEGTRESEDLFESVREVLKDERIPIKAKDVLSGMISAIEKGLQENPEREPQVGALLKSRILKATSLQDLLNVLHEAELLASGSSGSTDRTAPIASTLPPRTGPTTRPAPPPVADTTFTARAPSAQPTAQAGDVQTVRKDGFFTRPIPFIDRWFDVPIWIGLVAIAALIILTLGLVVLLGRGGGKSTAVVPSVVATKTLVAGNMTKPTNTPKPTKTPGPAQTPVSQKTYVVNYGMADEAAIGQVGRSGPSESYSQVLPELQPGILYAVVKYDQNPNWIIVIPEGQGRAGFYPANVLEKLQGNPLTGQSDSLPLESVDELLSSYTPTTQSSTGEVVTPLLKLVIGFLMFIAIAVMFGEAAKTRKELGDAVFNIVQAVLNVILGAYIPVMFAGNILLGVYHGIQPQDAAYFLLKTHYIKDVASIGGLILLLWVLWECLSPIRGPKPFAHGHDYDDDDDEEEPKEVWFPRLDFTPLGNSFLLAGALTVLGVITVWALMTGVVPGSNVSTLKALFEGYMTGSVPNMTAFANLMFMLAFVVYTLENIRAKQFSETVAAVLVCAIYFPLRSQLTWHPLIIIVIALAVSGGVSFALLAATKRNINAIKWFDLVLNALAVIMWIVVSFNVL